MEVIASLRVKVHSRGPGVHVLEYSNVLEQVVKRALASGEVSVDELDPDTAVLKALERSGSDTTRPLGDYESGAESGADASHASMGAKRLSRKGESVVYSQFAAAVVLQRAYRRKKLVQYMNRAAMVRASHASRGAGTETGAGAGAGDGATPAVQ